MASKKTPELVPLCHPVMVTFVGVEIDVVDGSKLRTKSAIDTEKESISLPWAGTGQGDRYTKEWNSEKSIPASGIAQKVASEREQNGRIDITATVSCDGKTGVEMEALTAASVAALTVYDMCKAVDKGMRIEGLRVVRKEGGKSGVWVEGEREHGE